MDNNWNFKTLGTVPSGEMRRIPVSTPLSRQGSPYSWTLDQIQNNLGKDCGSMNMEELLMNIYNTEGTQGLVPTNGANEGLHRQGSITLPRILSQKTVDEVWKYITEEEHTGNDGGSTNIPQIQKQPTLGDITLEEFLSLAGAMGNNNRGGYIHDVTLVKSVAPVPGGATSVDTCSPIMPFPVLDGIPKINAGSSLVSPFPYTHEKDSVRDRNMNNGTAVEKNLVEKIHRRKIKNRESAARSRARKQAQTMELEAEAEKLRKENRELLKKQAETMSGMKTKLMKGITNRSRKQLRRTKSDIQ